MMDKKLKSCPFCGGNNVKIFSECSYQMTGGDEMFYVECQDCGSQGGWHTIRGTAIEAWNTRKPIDDTMKQLEEYYIKKDIYGIASNSYGYGVAHGLEQAIQIVKGGLE